MDINDTKLNFRTEVENLIKAGHKIQAIKLVRELTGGGLYDSKTLVESITKILVDEIIETCPCCNGRGSLKHKFAVVAKSKLGDSWKEYSSF